MRDYGVRFPPLALPAPRASVTINGRPARLTPSGRYTIDGNPIYLWDGWHSSEPWIVPKPTQNMTRNERKAYRKSRA